MPSRTIESVLLVEDDTALSRTLTAALGPEYARFEVSASVRRALELLAEWTPDLLLLDVALPDGTAFELLDSVVRRSPMPLIVAISGQANADEAFRLAQLGVHSYVSKPFDLSELRMAVEAARSEPLDLQPHLRDSVGLRSLEEVEAEVRDTMLDEALARARGGRRGAARLLDVSRQLVQYMLRKRRY